MNRKKPDKRCGTCHYYDSKRKHCTWEAENVALHWTVRPQLVYGLTPQSNPDCGLWEAQHDKLW